MKCIKKLLAIALTAVLALTMLTACGSAPEEPLIQPDIEKGKEIAAVLNEARVATGEKEVSFDEKYSVAVTKYANAYIDCQCAGKVYEQNPTPENKAAWEEASLKYRIAAANPPSGSGGGLFREMDVASFEAAKANGKNFFTEWEDNGNCSWLVMEKGDMCSVTVVTKGDMTVAVISVGFKK